ncbi:glycogen debranching N-terminal domain-containing protein [Allorhizocola rhizosphaerae]|uniref:amylo-alpha-1,6-glucosidase n=1 Tax=Allorhizocola rhizosphaerae TaxID=1872709 RepID=UPI000E3C9119|nr:glycogen debranching N-terminal domain-containing protein [Allorhizocola rhizosphaerae]
MSLISVLDGNTFVVSDDRGDIDANPSQVTGLFSFDTRHVSRWVLTVDGHRLSQLSVDDMNYFETRFFLVPGTGTVYVNAKQSVIRDRIVCGGFDEVVTILNHDDRPVRLSVRLDTGADFADVFEVKDEIPKLGKHYTRVGDDALVLGYERDTYRRETHISSSQPAHVDEDGLLFDVRIPGHGQWQTTLRVHPVAIAPDGSTILVRERDRTGPDLRADLDRWMAAAPRLETDSRSLQQTYRCSLIDLAALRFSPLTSGARSLPAAGLPWFMTMFGRDSIITSLQALPFTSDLAATTLRELAIRQGVRHDAFRDEEPGRILHELRYGELTAFEERPHSPYYGSADATPLFVVLLDEYERWTGDTKLVRELEYEARAALRWLGDGYISYQTRNPGMGLENQCWKDSWDSISYRDGRLPGFPRATCELQGYAYDAKLRGARLARLVWRDHELADELERSAKRLKLNFNRDFWLDDGQYYALALDADGTPVDALSSNIGHLLWSGIVNTGRAKAIARHLMSASLFSGWGVRTLAEGEHRYNPIGYHTGTVWPFDNSIIAWGLRRYGFKQEAARIAEGILQAADFFHGRLPEAFAGYERSVTRYPVQYPTACSPQAWSTGAPLLLLRTMLGVEPIDDHLITDPALADSIGYLALLDIPGRWGKVDAFARGRSRHRVRV